jgi:phosphoribosylformylglycinamidine synthase
MSSFAANPLFLHIYRTPGTSSQFLINKLAQRYHFGQRIVAIETEFCFNVELERPLTATEKEKLLWILTETYEPQNVREDQPFLTNAATGVADQQVYLVEVGPRMAFSTAWSSNSASMFLACGINAVKRIERSRRFKLVTNHSLEENELKEFTSLIHDRMTECVYHEPLQSFDNGAKPVPVKTIPLLEKGKAALEELNKSQGLGFDDWDLDFYTALFIEKLQRNPTDVECFDLAQSNSEHSRHWFFGGKMVIDGEEKKETLFQMVKATLPKESNSVIAFHDNSSVSHPPLSVCHHPADRS